MFTELKALVAYGIPLVLARNYADRHRDQEGTPARQMAFSTHFWIPMFRA